MKLKHLLIFLFTFFLFTNTQSQPVSLFITTSTDIPPGTYNDISISGSSVVVTLSGNIVVTGDLTFADASVLNTGDFKITFTNSASNPNESKVNGCILGTAVMQSRFIGSDALHFLGINMESGADAGNITLTRVTGQNGRVQLGLSSGIDCRWNISTSASRPINRRMSFLWLNNFRNGKNPLLSTIWKYDGANWTQPANSLFSASGDPLVTGPISANPFGEWTISDNPSPLPVELDEFIASTIKNEVILDWGTGHELNNSHFVVERVRIVPAGEDQGEFGRIATVQGSGTTNNYTRYRFIDKNLESGKYLYRLNQVDYNGNNQYFLLSAEIIIGAPAKFGLSQNYPNPFNPVTKINYEVPENMNVSMKVYDLMGREVAELVKGIKSAGYYTAEFNGANLSSGIYFIRLIAGNYNSVKKISLIK